MSKAEERAFEAYPIIMHTLIPVHEDMPDIEQDCNVFHRQAYIKGYRQAEKDLELTWENMFDIFRLVNIVLDDYAEGKTRKEIGEEVLKRFKDLKHVK